jgi:hypothetical protein
VKTIPILINVVVPDDFTDADAVFAVQAAMTVGRKHAVAVLHDFGEITDKALTLDLVSTIRDIGTLLAANCDDVRPLDRKDN